MKLFDFLNKEEKSANAVGDAIMQTLGNNTLSITEADKGFAHIAVAKIAQVTASQRWTVKHVRKDGKVVTVEGHVLNKLLDKPNPLMTWRTFVYRLVGQREFTGFSPVLVKTVSANDVRVIAMNGGIVKPKFSDDGTEILSFDVTLQDGSIKEYTTKQIKSWFTPDFFDSTKMIGTADKIKDWLVFERAMVSLQRDMAKNRSYVGGVVKTNATSVEALKKWRNVWKARTKERGEDIILPEGADYQRLTLNAKEMELTAQDEAHTRRVLKAFNVPKELLGDVDTSGRANVDGAYYGFVKFKVLPILEELKEFLNNDIVPLLTSDESVFLDFENPVPNDKEFELKYKQTALGGKAWRTPNEIREEEGLVSVDNGDDISTVFTLGTGSRVPQRVKNAVYKVKEFENKKEKVESDVERIAECKEDEIEEALIEHIVKEFTGRVGEKQLAMEKVVKEHSLELQGKALKQLKGKKAKDVVVSFDVEEEAEAMRIKANGILEALVAQEGSNAFALVENPAGNYNPKSKKLKKAIKNLFLIRAESYTQTTLDVLNDEINEGIKNGETAKELEKRVAGVFDVVDKYRARTLSQDVVFTTANEAVRSAYEQSRVVETIKWYTAQDERVCAFCGAMHNKTVAINEKFFEKGDELIAGDSKLDLKFEAISHPPIHSGCRCFLLPDRIVF